MARISGSLTVSNRFLNRSNSTAGFGSQIIVMTTGHAGNVISSCLSVRYRSALSWGASGGLYVIRITFAF